MWNEHSQKKYHQERNDILRTVFRKDNYKNIIPSAQSLEEAITYLKGLYGTVEGTFTAYYFEHKKEGR
jgi:ASC-1-like (ASCH) protein